MKTKIVLAAAILLTAALAFLYMQTAAGRRRMEEGLAHSRAGKEHLQSQIDDLAKSQLSEADLARLKADQTEAAKLRGEVASLKQSLAVAEHTSSAAQKSIADAKAQARSAASAPEGNPEVRTLNSKINARLPTGHALALGGWESSPGKRSFALVIPEAAAAADQPIKVTTRWIEVTTAAAAVLQLDTFLNNSGQQSSLFPPDYLQQFLQNLAATQGARIISSPTVVTFPGYEATVSVTSRAATAAGPVNLGPEIQITPNTAPDGSIDLSVNATLRLSANNAPLIQ